MRVQFRSAITPCRGPFRRSIDCMISRQRARSSQEIRQNARVGACMQHDKDDRQQFFRQIAANRCKACDPPNEAPITMMSWAGIRTVAAFFRLLD